MSSAYQTGQRVRVRRDGGAEQRLRGRTGVIERVDDHRRAGALQVAYMILLDGEPAARFFLANDVEVAA
jgi:hypothetical protein